MVCLRPEPDEQVRDVVSGAALVRMADAKNAVPHETPSASPGSCSTGTGGRIHRLSKETANRIAAGEVIVRPSHALKELLENSLDAGAQRIIVEVQGGGLQFLEVTDDGQGIHKDDLPIVCRRFTTSKLRTIDELCSLQTFGFRGEALASLSHVAKVSITTSTIHDAPLAYTCSYLNGSPVAPAVAKSSGGTHGTSVVAESLFYNLPVRRQALQPSEEYNRILSVVEKYAIHYPNVAFTCRRRRSGTTGRGVPDLSTTGCATSPDAKDSNCNLHQTIAELSVVRAIHGKAFADTLAPFALARPPLFQFHGLISHTGFAGTGSKREGSFSLFINRRLVENNTIRRVVESVYQRAAGAGGSAASRASPWVYINIEAPSEALDVNVHPSKKEVIFLHEEAILTELAGLLQTVLESYGSGRYFYKPVLPLCPKPCVIEPPSADPVVSVLLPAEQSLSLSDSSDLSTKTKPDSTDSPTLSSQPDLDTGRDTIGRFFTVRERKPLQKEQPSRSPSSSSASLKVTRSRVDARQVRLHGFFDSATPSTSKKRMTSTDMPDNGTSSNSPEETSVAGIVSFRDFLVPLGDVKQPRRLWLDPAAHPLTTTTESNALEQCNGAVLDKLKAAIVQDASPAHGGSWSQSSFVGVIDSSRVLLQCDSELLLVDLLTLFKHAVYQSIIHRLGRLPCIFFDPPLSFDANSLKPCDERNITSNELDYRVHLLNAYFSLDIDLNTATLKHFPLCCGSYLPGLHNGELSRFILDVLKKARTNITEEEFVCNVSHLIAEYFSTLPSVPKMTASDGVSLVNDLLEFVFHPCINLNSQFLLPSECIICEPPVITAVTDLNALYRVFERC